jgi:integrase
MRAKLTESLVADLPVTGRDHFTFDTLQSGFALRVTPAGQKIFIAQARHAGRKPRKTIGYHPEMTVSEARRQARIILDDIRAGRDPHLAQAERARVREFGETTVAMLTDRWLAEHVKLKLKPRTASDYAQLVAQKIKPVLGHLSVAGINRDDVLKFHVSMARTPRRANYTVSTVRALMRFAEDVGLRPPNSNPAKRIKMFREGVRERFLSEAEISRAAEAIGTAELAGKIGPHAAAGLRLALLTGARSGELTAAKWSHVYWERRFIRLPDSKTNDARTIHLSDAALEVLRTLPRVGPFIVAGAKPGEPYKNLTRAWVIAREYAGLQDCRLHDLRHSYASLCAARGVSLQMIGSLLGHRVQATTARYAHLCRSAVAATADQIGAAYEQAIATSAAPPTENVVELRRRRRKARVARA